MSTADSLLPPAATEALRRARAMKRSYAVRIYATTATTATTRNTPTSKPGSPGDTPRERLVVVLGEAHVKLHEAALVGREVVSQFELRGVEGFATNRIAGKRLLGVLVEAPRRLLRLASVGNVEGSTITEASAVPFGHTYPLEKTDQVPFALHLGCLYLTFFFVVTYLVAAWGLLGLVVPRFPDVPWALAGVCAALELHMVALVPAWLLRDRSWAFLVHPLIAIVAVRDHLMAQGTVTMLAKYPTPDTALVVMGRAHLSGYGRELERRGFRRIE